MITNSLMIINFVLEEYNWAYYKHKNFNVDPQRKSDSKDKSFKTNKLGGNYSNELNK